MGIEQRNYCVFDLETTGLYPEEGAEIVQIGAIAFNHYDYSQHDAGIFEVILKPQFPEKANKEAIKIIGEELWERANNEGLHPKVGLRAFIDYIDLLNPSGKFWNAPVLVGFNSIRFDEPFLQYWLKHYKIIKNTKEWPWANTSIDVKCQMSDLFAKDNLPNRKLDTFLDMLGIPRSTEEHSAIEDVDRTAQIFIRYRKLMERVRKNIKILTPEEYQKLNG